MCRYVRFDHYKRQMDHEIKDKKLYTAIKFDCPVITRYNTRNRSYESSARNLNAINSFPAISDDQNDDHVVNQHGLLNTYTKTT